MIKLVAKLLGVDDWIARSLTIVVIVAGVLIAGYSVYSRIYAQGYGAAEAKYKAEIAQINLDHETERKKLAEADVNEQRRQTIANNAAKKREADAIAAITAKETEIADLRRKLRDEARKDPAADKPVLGADSVQRINQIR